MIPDTLTVTWHGGLWRDDRAIPPPPRVTPARRSVATSQYEWEATLRRELETGPQTIRQLMATFSTTHSAVYVALERLTKHGSVRIVGWVKDTTGRPAKQYAITVKR